MSADWRAGIDGSFADRTLHLSDGRVMRLHEYGDPSGFPVVALHGTPGSRLKFAGFAEAAGARGLRLVCPDRWGYGGSAAPPQTSLAAYAADIREAADRMGLERYAVFGISGGAPFAVAAAAVEGTRVAALALAVPVGPLADTPLDALGLFHLFSFRVMPMIPGLDWMTFTWFRRAFAAEPYSALRTAFLRSAAPDRALIDDLAFAQALAANFRAGLAPGIEGPLTDMALFGRSWDVDPLAIVAPSRIWLGEEDQNVPRAAALQLGTLIPGCEMIERRGVGHLWPSVEPEVVLDWLARRVAVSADREPTTGATGDGDLSGSSTADASA